MKKYNINTNYKYLSKNPINNYLVNNFNSFIKTIIKRINFSSILDVGCGEGIIFQILEDELEKMECVGIDLDPLHIKLCKKNAPFCDYKVANLYNLSFSDSSFEVVLCLEVLEHLEFPEDAIRELKRVSSKYILISVPREPIWRILNMVRMKYWRKLGNTPGHINNWSSKSVITLLKRHFEIEQVTKPLPWTIILCKKR